jgi:uncharacterized protein (TIGR03067 family)
MRSIMRTRFLASNPIPLQPKALSQQEIGMSFGVAIKFSSTHSEFGQSKYRQLRIERPLFVRHSNSKEYLVRPNVFVLLTSLAFLCQSLVAFSKQPISKGNWTFANGNPETVTFDYGTTLSAEELTQLSRQTSLKRLVMGYAGVDSEYVEIESDIGKLGRLKNLEEVHLCIDGMNDECLEFVALLPKLQILEFNADNGYDGAPICTDKCGDSISSAKSIRSLWIHDGQFTDKFVAKITEGLPDLEELWLSSEELTDDSLRLLSDRCKKLRSLSITSKHFTAEGLKHLDKLEGLETRSVSSPSLRKLSDPKEISELLGMWEYVSAQYDGKPIVYEKNETITLSDGNWTLHRDGKLISNSTWEIDSTRSPKWLTQFTRGGKVNFVDRWVYKFEDDHLVICKSSRMDGRRPTAFNSQTGDKQYLIVLRRKVKE